MSAAANEVLHEREPGRLDADLPAPCVQSHAANLLPLSNGDLACVWFGGTQEGVADISIWFSRLAPGATRWSVPVQLSDDTTRSEQNPILFEEGGRLWLIHTAQKSGHQDTALVRYRISEDLGQTWGPAGTLFTEAGIFVRQPVVVLDNGDWLIGAYYCRTVPGRKWVGDNDDSMVRISSDRGRTWREHPVPQSTGCVHMCVVKGRAPGALLGFFRSRWADNVYLSRSADNGRTWSAPAATELPNNNSSIQVARLADGHLAIVCNPTSVADATERRVGLYDEIEPEAAGAAGSETPDAAAPETGSTALPATVGAAGTEPAPAGRTAFWGTPRAPMTVAISADEGRTWPWRRNLETGDGYCMTNNSADKRNREYSYPTICQGPDGALHIAYTVFRQKIRYVRIREEWVTGTQQGEQA